MVNIKITDTCVVIVLKSSVLPNVGQKAFYQIILTRINKFYFVFYLVLDHWLSRIVSENVEETIINGKEK